MSKKSYAVYWLGVVVFGLFLVGCAAVPSEVETSRVGAKRLLTPSGENGFSFAIFGDRTGGNKDEGTQIWQRAITQTNRMAPDFVCTVGDLIWGYGDRQTWIQEANAFETDIESLKVPLCPVAGNHEIYWFHKTENRPKGHHESDYERHFGPLWYAFEYKNCWIISLFSDEGNPDTGRKSFHQPDLQRMSEEQFTWLKSILKKAKDADHVFLFLHHPRWTGTAYGDDWDKIHSELVSAGNVSAVFAGHFHNTDYLEKDGIDYYILGTTGGIISESSIVNQHLFYWVSVQGNDYQITGIPIDKMIDPKAVFSRTEHFLPRESWAIDSQENQMVEWNLSTEGRSFKNGLFKVIITDTWDESGDNGVRIRYLDENRKVLEDYMLKSKDALINTFPAESDKIYYLQISDEDVSFDNENPGNQGAIEGYLITRDIRENWKCEKNL